MRIEGEYTVQDGMSCIFALMCEHPELIFVPLSHQIN